MTAYRIRIDELVLHDVPPDLAEGIGPAVQERLAALAGGQPAGGAAQARSQPPTGAALNGDHQEPDAAQARSTGDHQHPGAAQVRSTGDLADRIAAAVWQQVEGAGAP